MSDRTPLYLDTSAFIPLVLHERGSEAIALAWDRADHLCSSRLLVVESKAALARAERMRRIDSAQHDMLNDACDELFDSISLINVDPEIIDRAAEFSRRFGLRGYDAVHLATADAVRGAAVRFASGDLELLQAARRMGMQVFDPNGVAPEF